MAMLIYYQKGSKACVGLKTELRKSKLPHVSAITADNSIKFECLFKCCIVAHKGLLG